MKAYVVGFDLDYTLNLIWGGVVRAWYEISEFLKVQNGWVILVALFLVIVIFVLPARKH